MNFAIVEISGIVRTENEVRSARYKAVHNELTTRKELNRILITKQIAVIHSKLIRLNQQSKRTVFAVTRAQISVEYFLTVPVIRNGYALNRKVFRRFPYV